MSALELFLFGQPRIFLSGKPLILQRNKGRALLFYLAVTAVEHSRQELAGLLWEMTEKRARGNLSVELGDLKNRLAVYLSIQGRQTIAFNRSSDYLLDVDRFKRSLASEQPTLSELQTAVDLYQGPFLLGFDVKNAPLFEQWVLTQRAQLEPMAFRAMYALAAFYSQQRDFGTAIKYIDQLLLLEPLVEEAHRQKMLLLALSGQPEAAIAQYQTCCAVFARDFDEPADETTTLYKQILAGKVNETMLPDSDVVIPIIEPDRQTLPFQTPAKLLHFVGRRQQITSLQEQLTVRSGTSNVCSLVGMGGVGKTTLAIYLADQLRDVFTDGVLWANVAISDPMDVLESWARAYGYDFTSLADLESRSAAWRGTLGEKKVLIVLDNATNAARVRPLLPNNSHSAVLLTTRDLDLARSLNTRVTLLTELSPANSQQLLAQILGEERIAAEPKAAVAICALLQHLPLAIEIIGQRLKSRPRRLLSAVANRLQAIDNPLAELEISDRAVRASFQVSWETLDAELRRIFALLAVFAGRSFTAVVLAGIDESDVYLVEDRLFTLTALSLVKEENPNRYRQHSLLADFASEKLGQSPDIYIRMAQYYQTFARTHQQNYEALRPEWDNLTAALKIAHQYEQWPLVMEYAKILHVAWFARGRYSEAQYGSQLAYQAAELTQAHKAKARFTYQWARALVEQSQYNEAQQLLRNNLEQYMALADNEGIAKVYYELARIGMEQAQLDEAEQLLRKSKQLRKSIGDSVGVAETIEGQARLFYKRGNYQAAHQHSLEALSCYEIADYQPGIVTTLRLLANSVIELHKQDDGDLGLAISYGQRALRLAEALQDRGEQAVTLYVLSRVHMLQNEFQQAEETGEQSLTLLEHIGDQRSQAIILTHLGEVHYSQGKYETALDLTYRSLSLCQKLKIDLETAVALSNIGVYYHCLGQLHKAKESWKKALPLAQALGHASLVVRIQKRLHAD